MADASKKKDESQDENPKATGRKDISEIREILFGEDLRNHDERFAGLEETIEKNTRALEKQFTEQITSLRDHVTNEVVKLTHQLENLDTKSSAARKALHEQLSEQLESLDKTVHQELAALEKVQANNFHQLEETKTDRHVLADLFAEVASRLKGSEKSDG